MSRPARILRTSIALAAVGILLGACGDNTDVKGGADGVPASASASSTQSEGSEATAGTVALPDGVLPIPAAPEGQKPAPLAAGRYRVPLSDTVAFDVDLAQGTTSNSDGLYLQSRPNILKVELAGQHYGVPVNPCHAQYVEPVGRTVQDLVQAIRNQPIYRVSHLQPVTIGDAKGAHLQIRISAGYNAAACQSGEVGLPGNPDTNNNNMPHGYAGDWWILDVHGHRVVAQEFCDGCTAHQRARVARQVQHITFHSTR